MERMSCGMHIDMANILTDDQYDAVSRMHNGCILCGDVGTGKSRTALYYYFKECGGSYRDGKFVKMSTPLPLHIITTARKRDTFEWDKELNLLLLSRFDQNGPQIIVDSWNNIAKYKDVRRCFFIFDEQRLVGSGAWVKAFYQIAKNNKWILLSATPGDKWMDYVAVFVANGYFRNRSEFIRYHVVQKAWVNHFEVDHYVNEGMLIKMRSRLLVDLEDKREAVEHHETVWVTYDPFVYKKIFKERMNIWTNEPIANASELCYDLQKVVNSDPSRIEMVLTIFEKCNRAIIFYNYDFELDILKAAYFGDGVVVAEWNGHKHEPVPETEKWVYLVQFTAGCEGWNCISTNTIIFYSQNYSYKKLKQACGRINRLTTPYSDLYYYHLKSHASIDLAIGRALENKKDFNNRKFLDKYSK